MPYREIAQDWPIRKIPGPRGGAWEMCLATDGSKHQDGSLLDARDSEELSMSRYRQVGLSRSCILPETAAVPGGYRSVRLIAPLVPRAAGVGHTVRLMWLCEAPRQAAVADISELR